MTRQSDKYLLNLQNKDQVPIIEKKILRNKQTEIFINMYDY